MWSSICYATIWYRIRDKPIVIQRRQTVNNALEDGITCVSRQEPALSANADRMRNDPLNVLLPPLTVEVLDPLDKTHQEKSALHASVARWIEETSRSPLPYRASWG